MIDHLGTRPVRWAEEALGDQVVEARPLTGGITWLAEWVYAGLEVWSFMVRIGNAIGVAMTTPQVGAALLASVLVSAAALYELNRLLLLERRTA